MGARPCSAVKCKFGIRGDQKMQRSPGLTGCGLRGAAAGWVQYFGWPTLQLPRLEFADGTRSCPQPRAGGVSANFEARFTERRRARPLRIAHHTQRVPHRAVPVAGISAGRAPARAASGRPAGALRLTCAAVQLCSNAPLAFHLHVFDSSPVVTTLPGSVKKRLEPTAYTRQSTRAPPPPCPRRH